MRCTGAPFAADTALRCAEHQSKRLGLQVCHWHAHWLQCHVQMLSHVAAPCYHLEAALLATPLASIQRLLPLLCLKSNM